MRRAIVAFLAVVGTLAILASFGLGVIGLMAAVGKPGIPRHTVLQIEFEEGVIETIPDDPLAQIMLQGRLELPDLLDALERAAEDDRVDAVVARIGGAGLDLAHVQEIRDAIAEFRRSGKPAIAYAETFGEFGPGNGGYYLATAFDKVYLQPSGDVGLTGLIYESSFLRGTLDKLGVVPQMDQRHEYKNAMNVYTEKAFTEPHRRAMQELMDSQFGQMLRGIGESRGKSEEEVRKLVDNGPYLGQEAVDAGLVDGMLYEDELWVRLEEQLGHEPKPLFVGQYLDRAGRPHTRGTTIALIHGFGAVMRGRNGYSPLDGTIVMGSDSVVEAFRAAVADDRVKAIVFRVDSPGGSYVASDAIWRETVRAREAGKTVIVSMGWVAGSGGYFVAMDADKIVAQPGTITGSIGVLGGKLVTEKLWDKLGVSFDHVSTSRNATMFSSIKPFNETEWARFQAWLDRVYADFTGKVASGRELPIDTVREIAKGRIWTGEQAKRIGLVDELGGLREAFRLAREAAGLAPDAEIRIKRFPARKSRFEALFAQRPDHRRVGTEAWAAALARLQPAVRALAPAVEPPSERVLAMPGFEPSP